MSDLETSLTAANIRCLLAVFELDRGGSGVRNVDIAERPGVSRPSVCAMIRSLCGKGYTTQKRYAAVHLTDAGREIAGNYSAYFSMLSEDMRSGLHMPEESCGNAVCTVLAGARED